MQWRETSLHTLAILPREKGNWVAPHNVYCKSDAHSTLSMNRWNCCKAFCTVSPHAGQPTHRGLGCGSQHPQG